VTARGDVGEAAADVERAAACRGEGADVAAGIGVGLDRVLSFRYAAGDGASVLVVRRDGSFATPSTAQPVRGGDWVTEVDGVTVFCTHLPGTVLVLGSEASLVTKAARSLTERES
jgi:hypothetical protein